MEEKKFKCPDCGKEFATKDIMLQHRKDAHPLKDEKQKRSVTKGRMITYAIIAVIVLAAVGIGYWVYSNNKSSPGSINSYNFSFAPYEENFSLAPYEGNTSAKINIIEFGDYQCPICGSWFTQTQSQVITNYVDTGKAKFYFLDFAFLGPDSTTLSQGAWCANEQNLYYPYHDFIYSNQGTENTGWATPDKVKTLVTGIKGLDIQQFSTCLDSNSYSSRISEESNIAAISQVQGTPTFFIGNPSIGYIMLVGNQPYSTVQQTLDSQLAKV